MKKSQEAMAEVITTLLSNGFQADGKTLEQTVRIPTQTAPVYGGIGGVLATFGGRQRFSKADTNIKVTVGARTTFFYTVVDNKVQPIGHYDTKDFVAIQQLVQEVTAPQN